MSERWWGGGGDGVLREWDRCWEWGSCVVRGMVKWRRVEGYGAKLVPYGVAGTVQCNI